MKQKEGKYNFRGRIGGNKFFGLSYGLCLARIMAAAEQQMVLIKKIPDVNA
jgi:hypothetical protein